MDIDQEWENFISSDQRDIISSDETDDDDETMEYLTSNPNEYMSANISDNIETPIASDIYISTKTKIAYLNTEVDLKIFWNIPVIPYFKPENGIIKKQMKFNSLTKEELDEINTRLLSEPYYEENIISHIDNPNGRIKFKDIRKVSIGISKKDIMSYRSKQKSAFYNCFVLILRLKMDDTFKEFHIKVFNTGKIEIPGIRNDEVFDLILGEIIKILQPHINSHLTYKSDTNETILINSNFNCGFFINRESLCNLLKYKYNIQAIYDPCCSYQGIQCKFYYNPDIGIQTGCQISAENKHKYKNIKKVSFMIFRTGSVLIVGKCDENVVVIIYEFLKNILITEFKNIYQKCSLEENITRNNIKNKVKKVRRKNVTIRIIS